MVAFPMIFWFLLDSNSTYYVQNGDQSNKQTNIPACNSGSNWWPRSWARARAWHTFTLCTNYLLHREQPGHILGRVRLWNFYETMGVQFYHAYFFLRAFDELMDFWLQALIKIRFFTGYFSNFLHKYPYFVQTGKLLVVFIFWNRSC